MSACALTNGTIRDPHFANDDLHQQSERTDCVKPFSMLYTIYEFNNQQNLAVHPHFIGFNDAVSWLIISYDIKRTLSFMLSCLVSITSWPLSFFLAFGKAKFVVTYHSTGLDMLVIKPNLLKVVDSLNDKMTVRLPKVVHALKKSLYCSVDFKKFVRITMSWLFMSLGLIMFL